MHGVGEGVVRALVGGPVCPPGRVRFVWRTRTAFMGALHWLALPALSADPDISHKLCGNEMAQAGEESVLAEILRCLTEKAYAPSRAKRHGRLAHRWQRETRPEKLLRAPKVRGHFQPCRRRQLASAKVAQVKIVQLELNAAVPLVSRQCFVPLLQRVRRFLVSTASGHRVKVTQVKDAPPT